jgi:phage baseplate assembly protein gpV
MKMKNLDVEVKEHASIKANTATIEAEETAAVKAKEVIIEGEDTKITGGKLTTKGTVTPTGQGPYCGLPKCLFTGADHVGDTVNDT